MQEKKKLKQQKITFTINHITQKYKKRKNVNQIQAGSEKNGKGYLYFKLFFVLFVHQAFIYHTAASHTI